jgi:hypothetical protein
VNDTQGLTLTSVLLSEGVEVTTKHHLCQQAPNRFIMLCLHPHRRAASLNHLQPAGRKGRFSEPATERHLA